MLGNYLPLFSYVKTTIPPQVIVVCWNLALRTLPTFPSRSNLKLYNISVSFKMVKNVNAVLNSCKVFDTDVAPLVVLKNWLPGCLYMSADLCSEKSYCRRLLESFNCSSFVKKCLGRVCGSKLPPCKFVFSSFFLISGMWSSLLV